MPIHTAVSAMASPKSFVITPPLTQMPATRTTTTATATAS